MNSSQRYLFKGQVNIKGKEFVIDAVSCEGIHYTTNGCLYTKISANNSDVVYKRMDFISPMSPELKELIVYNNKVLDALGIIYGPSHSEIMLTDEGPVLIEVGARIHGGGTPKTVSEISALSQLDLLLPSYLSLEDFHQKITQETGEFTKYACVYFFISQKEGIVSKIDFQALIHNLDSFYNLILHVSPGAKIQKTISLNTSPGWVVLINESKFLLEKDLNILESIDEDIMFVT